MLVSVHDSGEKKSNSSIAGGLLARKNSKNFLAGHTGKALLLIFPCRGLFRLAKIYKFSPKCTNSLPECAKCHNNSSLGVFDKKKVKKILAGVSWQEKIRFFNPRNSRETLPCPDLSRQMVSWEKNAMA